MTFPRSISGARRPLPEAYNLTASSPTQLDNQLTALMLLRKRKLAK
jgi:hypothetical protein